LVVVLLGVCVLDDLVELDDVRLLLLDPERGRARVYGAGREGPDGDRDHGHDEETDDGPAAAAQDVPEVPKVHALFLSGVRLQARQVGRRQTAWRARDQLDRALARREGARVVLRVGGVGWRARRVGHWIGTLAAAPTPKWKKSFTP